MSDKPTLVEFFEKRLAPANHVLQSATRALKTGMTEEIILACLLHDVVQNLIKVDHGWWGAQMIEPYVDEKIELGDSLSPGAALLSRSVGRLRVPRALHPDLRQGLRAAAAHQGRATTTRASTSGTSRRAWSRSTISTPSTRTRRSLDPFIDIIGRHFKQPKEGLGYDNSPTAHMWRTMMFPDNPL